MPCDPFAMKLVIVVPDGPESVGKVRFYNEFVSNSGLPSVDVF